MVKAGRASIRFGQGEKTGVISLKNAENQMRDDRRQKRRSLAANHPDQEGEIEEWYRFF